LAVGRYGSKDGVQMREMPEPRIGERDVLVAVRAASVNLLDAKIRDVEFKRILTVLLSGRTRLRARRRRVRYSFLFMKASGDQLRAIAALADAGAIRPVLDRVFPFESVKDAIAHVESGRAKGKVVITMAGLPLADPAMPPATHAPAALTQTPSTERAQP
jgi:NADPH:quinone reductase-like Zn-dependent oxidoreductase